MQDKTGKSGMFADRRVAVLLAVFNGGPFLQDQLDTLARQTVTHIDVWASDDGSTDGSLAVLERAASGWGKGRFTLLSGPRRGFAENFRALMTEDAIEADFVAFCDQDDLWDEDKLAAALEWLTQQDEAVPALYCTRTRTITAEGELAGFSPLFAKTPSFRNALVQSIAGANTMVMNRAAFHVVREASRRASFISHDWWCYLIVTGCGGKVHYSPVARLGYRQHAGNLVGENNSWRARMFRLRNLIEGRFARWNERNIEGLVLCEDLLAADARGVLLAFRQSRSGPAFKRLAALLRAGVYRQTFMGQFGLFVACLVNRL